MKRQKIVPLLVFFVLFLISHVFSQDWSWEWAEQNTQKDASAWMNLLNIDFENNIYVGTQYGDSLFLNDTVLGHEAHYDWANWAVSKYDKNGVLQRVIDIHTTINNLVHEIKVATDHDLNMYIAGEFSHEVSFLDTVIYGNPLPLDGPDLFLAKITPDLQIAWIKLIQSHVQDQCNGLTIFNGNLYMVTQHFCSTGETDTVNYLGQDTVIITSALCSLLKVGLSGNLIWRKELIADNNLFLKVRGLNIENNGNIILNGHTKGNLFYESDTIHHPHPEENQFRPFIMETDTTGKLLSGVIPDWNMVLSDLEKDDSGNIYFAGFVWDTLYFGTDTIIQHEDSTVNILARLNAAYEPLWYETTAAKTEQGSYYFYIDSYEDTLFFAGGCKNTFTLFDTVFTLGSRGQGVIGKVTPEGQLIEYTITHTQAGFTVNDMQLNNCNNGLYLSGGFKGLAYFGDDTLSSYSYQSSDGILTRLEMYAEQFSFGPDTTVCDSIRLFGPEEYAYYYWNDTPSEQNWLDVTESGQIGFACVSDNGCWLRDTIVIYVQPEFSIDLGRDTVIGLNDTLLLSVPDIYDSYLWSTGETGPQIEVAGNSLGSGDWGIWVDVASGVCMASDTIQLTVSSVNELRDMGVHIYPNPTGNLVYVQSDRRFEKMELTDQRGIVLFTRKDRKTTPDLVKIDLTYFPDGVYFIRIYFEDSVGTGKIIKL